MNPLGSILDVIPGVVPVDLQNAQTGDFVSLKNAAGVLIVFFKGAGTDGDDPTLELQQATAVAGGDAKDLNGFELIWKKQGTLTSVGTWTKVEQTADEDFVGDGTSAQSEGLYVAYVPASALDVAGGFDCLQANVKDVGNNPQLGCVLYILVGLRYQGAPDALPSAIAD